MRRSGANRRAAEAAAIEGNKRRRVLLALADFADQGRADPSITEICRRARHNRTDVCFSLDRMERDGLIEIRRGNDRIPRGTRSTYRLLLPGLAEPGAPSRNTIDTKEKNTMSPTKTKAAVREPLIEGTGPTRFRCWTTRWLAPLGAVDWPRWEQARAEHVAAVEAFEAAEKDADPLTEIEAARDLCDTVSLISGSLPGYGEEASAAIEAAAAPLRSREPSPLISGVTPEVQAQVTAGEDAAEVERLGEVPYSARQVRDDSNTLHEALRVGLAVQRQIAELQHRIREARRALREREEA